MSVRDLSGLSRTSAEALTPLKCWTQMQVDEQGAFSTEDVAAFTAAADSLFTAGNVLDRYGDRAALRTQSAVFEVISSFSTLFSSVAASAASFAASARRSQSHRSRWLEKQREEFTAVETILLTAVAMCEWDGVDLLTTLISVEQVALLAHSSTLPRLPSAVYIDPFSMQTVCDAIASCTHIQDGSMDCVIEGSGSVFCHPGVSASALQNNVITVTFISSGGESIRGLQSDDITVWITSADGLTVGAVSGAVKLINNSVSFGYGVDDDWVGEWIEVTVSVMNNLMSFQRRVPVAARLRGEFLRSIETEHKNGNTGLAISADGTLMAVSNWYSQDVIVYAVEDGQVLQRLGSYDQSDNSDGRLRFDDPYKMLFSPHDDRNLIIADSASNRVVEMNVDGTLVRFLEEIVPSDGNVYGLTANRSVIIVGGAGPGAAGNQVGWISVFDFVSGTLLRRFSGDDTTLEDFGDPVGVRITPDGKHIVVVEDSRDRLSLFTLAGEFVRRMEGHNYPKDVLFTSNGDMLVAEMSGSVVSLSSSDGSSAVEEVSYTSFSSPTALAFHGKVLFVLDADGPLVCLFV